MGNWVGAEVGRGAAVGPGRERGAGVVRPVRVAAKAVGLVGKAMPGRGGIPGAAGRPD